MNSREQRAQPAAPVAAAIDGTWQGTVGFDVPVPIVLHIGHTGGELSIVADFPLLRSAGIPVREASFADATLRFVTRSLGDYAGGLSVDGERIDGVFTKEDKRYPLLLRRGGLERLVPNRPQTPQPPFGYAVEPVHVDNAAAGCRLAGTLTLPGTGAPRAVVLLITGSGAMDRDETVFGHKPFWVLADHLSRRGYAVLRLDDRGVGESSGDRSAILPQDEVDDMAAALDFLHTRDDLHGLPIGLVAHSMGGVIGMTLAASRADVAFLVTMGSPGAALGVAFAEREVDAMRAAGADTDAIARHGEFTQALYRELAQRTVDAPIDAAQIAALAAQSGAGRQGPTHSEEWIARFNQPWFRGACRLDPADILGRVAVPLLAINGSLDVQALAKPNLAAIGDALAAAGRTDFQTIELPGLNHLFQTCKTGAVYEYPAIEETFAPLALETIRIWLDARFPSR
ncbi:MAG TPA: alpha/beta fold hydrolase [Dokdonella sp.]